MIIFLRISQIRIDVFLTEYTGVFLTDYTDLHRWFSHGLYRCFSHRFLRFAQIFFSQIPQILTDLHRSFLTGNTTRTDLDQRVALNEENVSV